jgi:hypothetical protein
MNGGARSLAVGVLLLTAGVRSAHADDDVVSAHLAWTAAASCLSRAALEERVSARLGRDAFVARDRAGALVAGSLRRTRDGWVAVLQLRRRDGAIVGTRELHVPGPDCAALDEPLTLVLALLVDLPQSDVRLQLPEPPARASRWAVSVETGAAASVGPTPSLAPGLRAAIGVVAPGLPRLELAGAIFAATQTEPGPAGVEVDARQVGVAACTPTVETGRLWLRGCLGVDMVALRGRGFGFARNHVKDRVLFAPAARGALGWTLVGPLSAAATIDMNVPLARPTFYASTNGGTARRELHEPAAVGVVGSLGLSLAMPTGSSR